MFKIGRILAVGICSGLFLNGAALADPVNAGALFSTGVDDLGQVLGDQTVDPHYTVSGKQAYVVAADGVFPQNGFWIDSSDSNYSEWITPIPGNASTDPMVDGFYDYQTTFAIDQAIDLSTAQIVGRWTADNCGYDMKLNGASTGNTMAPNCTGPSNYAPFNSWTYFEIDTGFAHGLNTLDFLVTNYAQQSGNPTGLRVEMTMAAQLETTDVPEPGSLALCAAGLGLLAQYRRKKKVAL